ncbi:mechanosensitive ion channel domain-containing protein [Paenibacillus sp. S-38]|uniref:mechanosensitive ion channel domain-containing protein n=1 Tax=Paenibacillus sp. S-38 TaxID=3416710 RepID=UPI003CF27599
MVEFEAFRELAAGEIRRLEDAQLALKQEVNQLRGELLELEGQWIAVTSELAELREQLETGLFPQPELRAYLESKLGDTVSITLPDASLQGVVITVGVDAVQIRETSGELVMIPLSQIVAVQ